VRPWDLPLPLDRGGAAPLSAQIAQGVATRIRAGALRPGARVPSSRLLARVLEVHRNTVLAAYAELSAEGWIVTHPARGTFVSRELPVVAIRRLAPGPRPAAPRAGWELPPAPEPRPAPVPGKILQLMGGVPDPRLVPVAALARAYRRALRHPENLLYGDPQGHPRLRDALATVLGEARGLAVGPEGILVTRGAQMALTLAARALLPRGATVAVEALGYRSAWEALRLGGARLVAARLDERGLDVEELARRVGPERIRAVYLTPHHQYPTTVALSPGRRVALLELARRERLLILEDDYDNEFHYQGRPLAPLASADGGASVMYVGTLSKVLAPGLRIGFLAGAPDAIARAAAHRQFLDGQGDLALEAAVAELLEEGEAQRHVWRTRRLYALRRAALAEALRGALGSVLTFREPPGGMAFWCRIQGGVSAERWAEQALARGVAVQPGRLFAFDGRARPYLRLGFGRQNERELREAVRRLAAALPGRSDQAG
jgi:GntR family transcriptional regulator/MocR family aminotransferase